MKFHQNFFISLLLFVLLFVVLELKNIVLIQDNTSLIINNKALSDFYSYDLLGRSVFSTADKWPHWISIPLRLLLTFVPAMMITRTAIKNLIFNDRSYLPIILLPIISMGISSAGSILTLVLAILQIGIFSFIFTGFKRSNSIKEFFYASILASISTIFYAPSFITFITILISVAVLNRGFKELFCSVIGFAIPLFLCSYIYWILDDSFTLISERLWISLTTPTSIPASQWLIFSNKLGLSILTISLLPIIIATFTAIFSSHYQLRHARRRQRKFYNLLVFQLLAITSITFLIPGCSLHTLSLAIVPLTMILSCYFNWDKYKFSNLLLKLIPIGIIAYNISLIFILK